MEKFRNKICTGVGKLVDPMLYPKENEAAQTVIHASIKYNVHFLI